jgi:kynurenine formamidase
MKFYINNDEFIETNLPLDISIPLSNTLENPRAWHVNLPVFEPVMANGFVGSVAKGGSVNFRNIFFNPHGHGTHTECLGHITSEVFSVNNTLKSYFFNAKVITIEPKVFINPTDNKEDRIILKEDLKMMLDGNNCEALVLRTSPNGDHKIHINYTQSNPAYLDVDCVAFLNEIGVKHFLLDLPSVDREEDGGKLAFHHAFWQVPENPQFDKTITEMIFVEDSISDGNYILEMQIAPFENDASPSRPVLYQIFRQ